MKKQIIIGTVCAVAIITAAGITVIKGGQSSDIKSTAPAEQKPAGASVMAQPEFYRGIYLTQPSGKNLDTLKKLVEGAKKSNFNVMVIDVQPAPNGKTSIPKENVDYLIANGIYPIARVVCFDGGLKSFPIEESVLQNKIAIAKSACEIGFPEIQFDYIRFNDDGFLTKIPTQKKAEFIEGFLSRAKNELKPYNVKIAADVFGRIPLNSNDSIGQRMEGLDNIVDVICPMAYPSHYTWSEKMMKDPYYTVYTTSVKGRDRVKKAQIVSYIQAFKIKVGKSGLTYDEYVLQQIKACHDAKIKGYILWNARQDYIVPFKVAENYYKDKNIAQINNTAAGKKPSAL